MRQESGDFSDLIDLLEEVQQTPGGGEPPKLPKKLPALSRGGMSIFCYFHLVRR